MSTDPAKEPTLATAVSIKQQQTPAAGWRADNNLSFDSAKTSALMMQMGNDENDGGGGSGSVWKKVAFYAGVVAASLIVFWYFSLRIQFAQEMNKEFINAANNLKSDVEGLKEVLQEMKKLMEELAPGPTSSTAIQIPKIKLGEFPVLPEIKEWDGQRQMKAQNELLAYLIEAFLNSDFLRMVVVVVCSIALAPAIKCKFLKLLVLATFIGIALSFLMMNIQQIVDLAAFFSNAATMKEYLTPLQELKMPTTPSPATKQKKATTTSSDDFGQLHIGELQGDRQQLQQKRKELQENREKLIPLIENLIPSKMLMAMCFIQLLIVFFLFLALLAAAIAGFIAYSGDLTTTSDDNETSADSGGGPATKMLTTTTNTAMLPSGMQMQPSGPRAKPPSTMETMDATYGRLAFG